jgi:threonine dehydratase
VSDLVVTSTTILQAARRLEGRVRRTPLERAPALSAAVGAEVLLKLENFQRTGSFKVRGALNAMLSLDRAGATLRLVTASAGNHGLGVALSARLLNIPITVFVPRNAAETKRNRIARLGADLRLVDGGYEQAHAEAEEFAASTGAKYLHAFSDPAVVAGQGTVGLEILQERPDVGTLLVPVGGGGLIGGIGVATKALAPGARVIGVQSTATAAMQASLAAGRVVSPPEGRTLCDGLAGDIDERSFALARRVIDEMVLVEEAAIARAIRFLYVEEGIVAEGSGAVVAAALLERSIEAAGLIGAVVSGGNLDATTLVEVLTGPGSAAVTTVGARAPGP